MCDDGLPPPRPIAKVVEHPATRADRAEHLMHVLADAGDQLLDALYGHFHGVELPWEVAHAIRRWREVRNRI